MMKVFLSHANEDKPIVRELCYRLRKDGFDPWLDEERILPGQDWNLEIEKALGDSDTILLCFSNRSSNKHGVVQREFKRAMRLLEEKPEGAIFIIPVRLDDSDMPLFIRDLQWVQYPAGYDRLLLALHSKSAHRDSQIDQSPKDEDIAIVALADHNEGDIHCADFIGGDRHITYSFSQDDVERLIEKVLSLTHAGGVLLPAPGSPDSLQIEYNGTRLVFHPGAIQRLSSQKQEKAYMLSITLDQEYQRWATRFVPLAGKMDVREFLDNIPISYNEIIVPSDEFESDSPVKQRPINNIMDAVMNYRSFIILGEPGAGKTATLQKIAYDAAHKYLDGYTDHIPLFVRLSQQGDRSPYLFLKQEWEHRIGTSFETALSKGRVLILADGINELPRETRHSQLKAWMIFDLESRGANQLIFSGRESDYDNQLSMPRVVIQPLDASRISEFLKKHDAEDLHDLLNDSKTRFRDLASNPLNLFILTIVYLSSGKKIRALDNRGRLFQLFTGHLLQNEQRWHPDNTSVNIKVKLLAKLAYEMQWQGSGTTFSFDVACKALPEKIISDGDEIELNAAAFFRFARGASIFDPLTVPDIRFHHHLLQEYFAARQLLTHFQSGEDLSSLWVTTSFESELDVVKLDPWSALPAPPTTGWEVTTILACGLTRDPKKLIDSVRQVNPILAGRCLDEAGIEKPQDVYSKTQADLMRDLNDPKIDLRTRLQAGLVLGNIGDPRFQSCEIKGVRLILPELIDIPGGHYPMGSSPEDKYALENEYPRHMKRIKRFSIGRWPVTRAEFACFVDAGGYTDTTFWKDDLSRSWLMGSDLFGGQMATRVKIWKQLQERPTWRLDFTVDAGYTPDQIQRLEHLASLSLDELIDEAKKELPSRQRNRPAYWVNPRHSNPSQPIVGVTLFEAKAYCEWVSFITGVDYRLPTEFEWEASSRGKQALIYPWGNDWDKEKANTSESHIWKTSPVGLFKAMGGVSPYNVEDQAGNVWEWTSSIYKPYLDDGGVVENTTPVVVRGGAWYRHHTFARCAHRGFYLPDNFSGNLGFRMVSGR